MAGKIFVFVVKMGSGRWPHKIKPIYLYTGAGG